MLGHILSAIDLILIKNRVPDWAVDHGGSLNDDLRDDVDKRAQLLVGSSSTDARFQLDYSPTSSDFCQE